MKISAAILLGCMLLFAQGLFAQDEQHIEAPQLPADSTINKAGYVKANEFYDALQSRAGKSRFTDLLVNAIVVGNDWRGDGARQASQELIDETAYFSTFEGKEIANIYILPRDVYGDSLSNFFTQAVNALHYTTREQIIAYHLLFKVGDKVNPQVMIHNEKVIRSLNFISDAYILVKAHSGSDSAPGTVDIYVYSRDHWSINLDFDEKASGEYALSAYDNNFLGLGHVLTLGTYFRTTVPHVNGYIFNYNIENIMGSFVNLGGLADMSYEQHVYQLNASKPFMRPTDYAGGGIYRSESITEGLLLLDTALPLQRQTIDLWSGLTVGLKENYLHRFFLSGRWRNMVYHERHLPVDRDLNPYYHNSSTLLLSAGLYRESFYRGSHIYGFAYSEDIPYGYKLELTGGYRWGEFMNNYYLGARFSAGLLMNGGYLNGSIDAGSFYDGAWNPRQSAVVLQLRYFTNLIRTGKGGVRNFIRVDYVTGFNRLTGEREKVMYGGHVRMLNGTRVGGWNRGSINMESVYFSPLYFYNFRFAFYAFADMGWLGDDYRVFRNDFSLTMGLGVRIKNDRLIFTAFQFQLGFAVLNPSGGSVDWFRMDNEPRANAQRYTPSAPETVLFQ